MRVRVRAGGSVKLNLPASESEGEGGGVVKLNLSSDNFRSLNKWRRS